MKVYQLFIGLLSEEVLFSYQSFAPAMINLLEEIFRNISKNFGYVTKTAKNAPVFPCFRTVRYL